MFSSSTFLKVIQLKDHSISPTKRPFLLGDNFQSYILKRGNQKKIFAWGDLKISCERYLSEGINMFLAKKNFSNEIWLWVLNFKFWSWHVLVNQSLNVVLIVLKDLRMITRRKTLIMYIFYISQPRVGVPCRLWIQHHIFNELSIVYSHSKSDSQLIVWIF